jgi:hypothetical protein
MNSTLLQKLSMRLRLIRIHGSYLVGVGTVVLLVFYLASTVRDPREIDTVQDTVHEEELSSGEKEPELSSYIVSIGGAVTRIF